MGLRFVIDEQRSKVALYCSTTGYAFGPVLDSEEEAEAFVDFAEKYARELEWEHDDPRSFTPAQLDEVHRRFVELEGGAEDPPKLREERETSRSS